MVTHLRVIKRKTPKHTKGKVTMVNTNKSAERLQDLLEKQNDHIYNAVRIFLQQAIEHEFEAHINAKRYERNSERKGHRNGYYTRNFNTRVGSMTLHVCRDREGNFQPSLFDKYQRNEKALVSTIVESYFSGVSTRKVKNILQELCGLQISKSFVSNACKALDEQVEAFRNRPLIKKYLYRMVDARYEHVRENGRVVSKGFVVIIGITADGEREIIGTWVINSESYSAWNECFRELKERGLNNILYVVSDENPGLCRALKKNFQYEQTYKK